MAEKEWELKDRLMAAVSESEPRNAEAPVLKDGPIVIAVDKLDATVETIIQKTYSIEKRLDLILGGHRPDLEQTGDDPTVSSALEERLMLILQKLSYAGRYLGELEARINL